MVRRRREEHHTSKTGHERWLVSYADFITLLFGFFVVMYSVSQVNEQKYRELSTTLSSVFQGNTNVPRVVDPALEQNPLEQKGQISGLSPEVNLVDTQVLAKDMEDALVHLVESAQVRIAATEEWVQIDLNANLLFDSGSATPKPEARTLFRDIAAKLAPYDNLIEVSGHTDNVPIQTPQFQSNWELSAARASSVVRVLADNGVQPHQMAAVGYGEFRPVADNATAEGRSANCCGVLVVARQAAPRPVVLPDAIHADPISPPAQPPLSPLAPPGQAQPPTPLPSETTLIEPIVQPVRLKHGGLLFTTDPTRAPAKSPEAAPNP